MTRETPFDDWTTLPVGVKTDLKMRVKVRADELQMSVSEYVRELVRDDINNRDSAHRNIDDVLVEFMAGSLIEHEAKLADAFPSVASDAQWSGSDYITSTLSGYTDLDLAALLKALARRAAKALYGDPADQLVKVVKEGRS